MITFTAGDTEFQKTLTEREKEYIHRGQNWISKLGRETTIKSLHRFGYTLDQVDELPEDQQREVYKKANDSWESYLRNNHTESSIKIG